MAGGEIYRVEIPIIVDDQTDKPLQQAEQKISKLEQHARKENERMRQHFMKIAKLQIEPIMKVRDNLTSGVLKADKLIRQLDMAQASPLIAAQDRVSAVVTRTNAMLDALDKGKVDVVASMKGPLMDELIKAKKAVADLGDAKAGPVAELKGELFYQLSKAQSMIKNVDRMTARPRIRLRDMATNTIHGIYKGLRFLVSKTWTISIKVVGHAFNVIKGIAGGIKRVVSGIGRVITSPLTMLGVGVGAAGAIAGGIIKPLDLAGDMEQSRIAFETMLGSAEKAQSFLKDMQKFAATTPFEFPELQENAKLMMAFGFSAEKIMPMLRTVGDTAAGLGAGSEGIERMVRALGQMQAKGRIQSEELLQLQELGVPAAQILQEELGLTAKQVGEIGKSGISSGKVIDALLRGMEKRFGGLMDKQSRSLKGLWSNIKDTFQMNVLWRWGEGIRKAVQPRLQAITDWFDKNEKTIEKWGNKLEKVAGQASEWVLNKLEKTFKWLDTNFFSNEEFMQLDFQCKVKFAWDTIQKEFDTWWSSSGEKFVTEKAAMIGKILGGGIGGFLMAALGVAQEPDKLANESPFIKAGAIAGSLFLEAFLEAFDAQKIADKAWEVFKGGQKEALKVLPGGKKPTLASWLNLGIDIWLFKKLGGFKALKWIGSKIGWEKAGETAAKTAATASATTATASQTVSGISKIANFFKDYKAAYQLAREVGKGPFRSIFEGAKILKGTTPVAKASRFGFFKDYKAAYQLAREVGKGPFRSIFEGAKILKETSPVAKASKFSKFFGKLATPLAIIGSVLSIATAEDKGKAIGKEVGSWAGFAAGAKLGAAAGTAIAPGIGTAILGVIGGIAGAFGGDWLGGKIVVDWGRNLFGKKTAEAIGETSEKVKDFSKQTQLAQADTHHINNQLQRLYGISTELASGYSKIGEAATISSDLARNGMDSMADAVNNTMNNVINIADITARRLNDPAFAAGYNLGASFTNGVYTAHSKANYITRWMINQLAAAPTMSGASGTGKLFGGPTLVDRVNESIKESFQASGEAGQMAVAHAVGGILTRPHLGMVAEAGPEAIIPLSTRMRPRALELWQQTGELLGVMPELPKLTGQAVITGDKDISENIQRVTDVSETTKKFADVVDIEKYQRLIDEVAYPANINEPQLRTLQTLPGKVLVKSELNDVLQLPPVKPILSKLSLYNRVDETQDKTISKNMQQTTEAIETTRRLADIIDIEQYRTLKRMRNDISHYVQQKANISETTRRLTNVIDIEQYRNLKKTRNNTINENQMQFITAANKIQTVKAYATGGILTKPHIGLVAEAGPEVIIPLSTRMRARALALYEETGRRLGVRPYAEGGFAGALTQNREQKIPVSFTPSFATLGPATINLNFDLTGLVRQVVIENREDIDSAVDSITDAIANNLRAVFQNMTK